MLGNEEELATPAALSHTSVTTTAALWHSYNSLITVIGSTVSIRENENVRLAVFKEGNFVKEPYTE